MSAGPDFRPVAQPRAHEYVAEQIRRQIALRLIRPGEALPPERELARLFGVARKTVQEAVRALDAAGLVETRRGRNGGSFVIAPESSDAAHDRLLVRIRSDRALIEEALVYRLDLEPAAAAHAAVARTAADLRGIRSAARKAARARSDAEFMEWDTEFHLALARATKNRFLAEGVERARLVLNDAFAALPESEVWHARSNQEHALVVDAVEARNGDLARESMRVHVLHSDHSIRALLAALLTGRGAR